MNAVASDPLVRRVPEGCGALPLVADPYAAATGTDAVVVTVPSNVAQDLDPTRVANAMRGRLVLDVPNTLDAVAFTAAGLDVVGTGWAPGSLAGAEVFLTSRQG